MLPQDIRLEQLVWEGAKKRYHEITPLVEDRVRFELSAITSSSFSNYFLIVYDFIKAARAQGALVGPACGSAAGSIVVYCLGITGIDPLQFNLLFERLVNPDGKTMPDICSDFDIKGREVVLNYIIQKYGRHQVALSASDPNYIVISNQPQEGQSVRMDCRGIKILSIIHAALAIIKDNHNVTVNLEALPLNDPATFDIFRNAETDDIFLFSSNGMKEWLRFMKPDNFTDLIALNALFHHPPLQAQLPVFANNKINSYHIPESILQETYGVVIYQEQLMLLAQQMAGFSKGDSDMLRRALTKKNIPVIEQLKTKFLNSGAPANVWADWENIGGGLFNKSHSTGYSLIAYRTAWLKAHFFPEYMKACGIALIVFTFLTVSTTILHRAGGNFEHLLRMTRMIIVSHSIAILSLPLAAI